MENQNLRVVELIHDITQLDYHVQFCGDFNNMLRIEYYHHYDGAYYQHEHRGSPDGTKNQLEKEVIKSLQTFLDNIKDNKNENT